MKKTQPNRTHRSDNTESEALQPLNSPSQPREILGTMVLRRQSGDSITWTFIAGLPTLPPGTCTDFQCTPPWPSPSSTAGQR